MMLVATCGQVMPWQQRSYRRALRLAVCGLFVLGSLVANAQGWDRLSNPTVELSMTQPPDFGLPVERLVVQTGSGNCSDLVADALAEGFRGNGVEVIHMERMDDILAENGYEFGGLVDERSHLALGDILDASALIDVNGRCHVERERDTTKVTKSRTVEDPETGEEEEESYVETIYYSETRVALRASILTTDLMTGRILEPRTIRKTEEERTSGSRGGYPEYPRQHPLMVQASHAAVPAVRRFFLPRTTHERLVFFDGRKCGLKAAHRLLKADKVQEALDLSLQNLETCRKTPRIRQKILAHAHYNVGMSQFLLGRYDEARKYIGQAAELHPGGIMDETMAAIGPAERSSAAMRQMQEDVALRQQEREERLRKREAEGPHPREAARRATRTAHHTDANVGDLEALEEALQDATPPSTLTNEAVVDLANAGWSDLLLVELIRSSPSSFDTSVSGLKNLKNANITDTVIVEIMRAGHSQ